MRLFELTLENEETDGVFALSLVENPAIEMDFVYFGSEYKFQSVNDEKRLIVGPILVPNKKILRVDGAGIPYEVYLSEDTVRRIAHNYMKNGYQNEATLEHDKKIDGVSLTESWIVESREKDKSKLYNMTLPVGTWAGVFKIENDEIWEDYVKTGKVKGISVEGIFEHLEKTTPERMQSAVIMEAFQQLIEEQEAEYLLSQVRMLFNPDKRFKSGKRVEMESYSDYGEGIRNNAKKGIELNEKYGNKCATPVGKVRAQQLAQGKPISVETIKRMHSYLSRAETYYDSADSQEDCGYISFLLWGGKAALGWSRNKLRELGLLEEAAQPSIASSYPGQTPESGSYISPALFVEAPNMDVLGYETSYFQICPMAQQTFTTLLELPLDDDTIGMVRSAAVIADRVFEIEAGVLEEEKATPIDEKIATVLIKDFKDIMNEIAEEVGQSFDVSYMDGHLETIKSFL